MGLNRVTVRKTPVDVEALLFALDMAPAAKVGYPIETTGSIEHPDADAPMAQVAAWQENGTETAPPRPFMRQGADVMLQRRGLAVPHVRRLVMGKMHGAAFITAMGMLLKSSIEEAVKRQGFAPLAPATVAAKGSAEILVDSGEMIEHLDVHVARF